MSEDAMLTTQSSSDAPIFPSVLVVHNRYRQWGGEDTVVYEEVRLLQSLGGRVETFITSSSNNNQMARVILRPDRLFFNRNVYKQIRDIIQRCGADVIHTHNLFPLLSTSVYAAARDERIPIVQTVHNYRMSCLNGLHLYNGQMCERCRPGEYLSGIVRGCYRGLHVHSAVLGAVQKINYSRSIWDYPTCYIAPCQFVRTKLIGWGIDPEKIVVKPHFVPGNPAVQPEPGEYALFVGRLSPEKGLHLLLDAWGTQRLPLVIVGDGPQRAQLEARVRREKLNNVSLIGYKDRADIERLLSGARFLIMPSIWYETFGLVLIEAYAHGVPVIATRLGAMADAIRDGETGLLFELNDRADLIAKLDQLQANPERLKAMRRTARCEFETHYTAHTNAQQLARIYADAIRGAANGLQGA